MAGGGGDRTRRGPGGGFGRGPAGGFPARGAGGLGFPAPDFQAKGLDDPPRVAPLGDYDGSVVLLNVWATWCLPCREEMPSIERLYRELGPKGLRGGAPGGGAAGAA